MPKVPQCESPLMIKYTTFDEYKEKFKDLFLLERSESGVLTAKWHKNGDSAPWDYPLHRGLGQLFWTVGQDAETEVLIIGGAGDNWLIASDQTSIKETLQTQAWSYYEHSYYDGCNMIEGLVNDVEQPTIGVINGGYCFHSEIALLCDITLMAEDAVIADPHYILGGVPGDGIEIGLRTAMGYKRANYAMLTGQRIDAKTALEYGMVNEVLPKDKIWQRAQEIGEQIAKAPRITRRVTTQITREPVKEQLAKELRMTFGTEMWSSLAISISKDNDVVTHDEATRKLQRINAEEDAREAASKKE
ncbi:MAG: enoyl-CoA hydratase/isomerase family protein [Oscillospiraceae bacterium]